METSSRTTAARNSALSRLVGSARRILLASPRAQQPHAAMVSLPEMRTVIITSLSSMTVAPMDAVSLLDGLVAVNHPSARRKVVATRLPQAMKVLLFFVCYLLSPPPQMQYYCFTKNATMLTKKKPFFFAECDDSNLNPGDGCNQFCTKEVGWLCVLDDARKSHCDASLCGDGIIAGGEECDDLSTLSNDGCSGCIESPGWTCTGEPSVCSAELCGDSITAGVEGQN